MRNRTARLLTVVIAVGLLALALPALAQGGPPPGGGGGFGGPGMGGPMGPPPMPTGPSVTMVVSDGVIYVACDGTLTAYEAKTLKPLAQVTYWERPQPPDGPMGPGGNRGGQPAGPPPAAP